MEIKGKVHCLFEQSGTFKKEFQKLGYSAYDYDIQDDCNETDYVLDLFTEIERAYADGAFYSDFPSIFDNMQKDDLIIAFFPCIMFCQAKQTYFYLTCNNYAKLTDKQKIEKVLENSVKRTAYYNLLVKLVGVCLERGLRLIIENPWTAPHFLMHNFLKPPAIIDNNRMERGDYFKKPTAYWFFNCEPAHGFSHQNDKKQKIVQDCERSAGNGFCSKERSMISPDYARNWICDFVLGREQHLEASLFDEV